MNLEKFFAEIISVFVASLLIVKRAIQNYDVYGDKTLGFVFIIFMAAYLAVKIRQKIKKTK